MLHLVITWTMIKWLGIPLFLFALISFLRGDLPDNAGSNFWNAMRYVFWPLFLLWFAVILIRAFII